MQSLEQSAKTVDEAIALALQALGVTREEVEVVVLSEGRPGFLGIGAEEARVRVTVLSSIQLHDQIEQPVTEAEKPSHSESTLTKPSLIDTSVSIEDEVETARVILEDLLALMNVNAEVVVLPSDDETDGECPTLDVTGDDLGVLIGRRGSTLAALQFIVNLLASKKLHRQVRVPVDVAGYRYRRQANLRSLALRLADRVGQTRQSITMEQMPAAERRVIHLALASHPLVTTQSMGEGDNRRVVILPKPR